MINTYICIASAVVLSIIAFGFYMFMIDIIHLPKLKIKKNIIRLSNNTKNKVNINDVFVNKIAVRISKSIKLNPIKKIKLENEFQSLNIAMTPEMYYATAITKGMLWVIPAIAMFFILTIAGILLLIMAFLIFLMELNKIDKLLQKHRRNIESELPKFVAVIQQTLKYNRNVQKMLSEYVGDNDTDLCNGLKIVLADMQTGNAELALNRFSNRVSSVHLSETMRGLMAAMRGDDVINYFGMLNIKLWESEKIRIEKDYMKTPNKVKFLIFGLMACMAIIYITVFATVLTEGLSGIMMT